MKQGMHVAKLIDLLVPGERPQAIQRLKARLEQINTEKTELETVLELIGSHTPPTKAAKAKANAKAEKVMPNGFRKGKIRNKGLSKAIYEVVQRADRPLSVYDITRALSERYNATTPIRYQKLGASISGITKMLIDENKLDRTPGDNGRFIYTLKK
jgi:hypothetical protein